MEKTEQIEKHKPGRGGKREGAGRPKGGKNLITIEGLLQQVYTQAQGQDYEELLVADFISARQGNDQGLLLKYHNLILNKVMNSLAKVEVTDSEDAIESKKLAFADALARLTGIKQE